MINNKASDSIIFYDGDCGLCQRSISFLSRIDTKKKLAFAPLNGATYKKMGLAPSELSTVIFYHRGVLFIKSEAIMRCLLHLSPFYIFVWLLKLIPAFIRDFLYDLVAKNRHKVNCILVVKDDRFLD